MLRNTISACLSWLLCACTVNQPPESKPQPSVEAKVTAAPLPAAPQFNKLSTLWDQPVALSAAPVALPAGVLLCRSDGATSTLMRLDEQGSKQWETALAQPCSTALVVLDGLVVLGIGERIKGVDLRTGTVLWTAPLPVLDVTSESSSLVQVDDRILFAQRQLSALDRDGKVQWTTDLAGNGDYFPFKHSAGLAQIRAGSASPAQLGSSSSWGQGAVDLLQPSARLWSPSDITAAVNIEGLAHFVSAPLQVEPQQYFLMQREQEAPLCSLVCHLSQGQAASCWW